jgi:hypothetical protein
VESYIDKEN